MNDESKKLIALALRMAERALDPDHSGDCKIRAERMPKLGRLDAAVPVADLPFYRGGCTCDVEAAIALAAIRRALATGVI